MQTFDYFVGNLKCQKCGHVSEANEDTNIQTKICVRSYQRPYRVGDKLELDIKIEDCGYVCVSKPYSQTSFNLIETWECPECDEGFNWVLVKIEESRIVSVKEITADLLFREDVHYVTSIFDDIGWDNIDNVLNVRAR